MSNIKCFRSNVKCIRLPIAHFVISQNWTHEAIESVKRTTQDQEWVLVTKSAGEGLYEVSY